MGGTTLTRTTFDAVQRRIPGAEFAAWEGWDWIAGFGNAHAEHRAVRTACGVWDESPLQKWVLEGRDALVAADRCFTNDMHSLRPGQLRYGAFCDDDGRMLGDGTVFAFAPDRCLVVTALESDGEAAAGGRRRAGCSSSRIRPTSCRTCSCRDRGRERCSSACADSTCPASATTGS